MSASEISPSRFTRSGVGLLVLLSAVAVALQIVLPTVPDVSWLFVVAEKMLAGQRLYVDVVETNPPMSVFLYTPAVWLEHIGGLSAETWQMVITFGLIVFELGLSALVMTRAGMAADVERFLLAGAQALAVLPMIFFSEREHIAVVIVLPALIILIVRAEGRPIDRWAAVLAGLGAGLAAAIKPHFALVILLPAIYVAVRRRSIRHLFTTETVISALVFSGYAAVLLLDFRVYFSDILPMLEETYRMERYGFIQLAMQPTVLAVIGLGLSAFYLAGSDRTRPTVAVLMLAALGFMIAVFEQGKGWRYHLYPALALIYIVFFVSGLPRLADLLRFHSGLGPARSSQVWVGVVALAAMIGIMPLFSYSNRSALALKSEVAKLGPHPTVLAVSYDLSIGHPLTRMVNGTWVGTMGSQWLGGAASFRSLNSGSDAAIKARMAYWIAFDRNLIAHDIRTGRPDVIVADKAEYDWDEMVATTAGMRDLLGNYQKTAAADGIELLVRRDLLADSVAQR